MIKKLLLGALEAKTRIETLKAMPQRIEGGVVYDFNNNPLFNVSNPDKEILGVSRVGVKVTDALIIVYTDQLAQTDFLLVDDNAATKEELGADEPKTLEDQVLDAVKAGDKKLVRSLCKELKEKWFALAPDDVENAIDDIKDCVADKDVNEAQAIIDELVDADVGATAKEPETYTEKATGDDSELEAILEDLKGAIEDDDKKDIEACMADLADEVGRHSKIYEEWNVKVNPPTEEENDIVDEIIGDLETAIVDKNTEEVTACLGELADEIGEDSDIYKEWADKATPKEEPKKSRRNRRGNSYETECK